ncbi:MAG: hypothetical protein IJR28_06280 [Ottowia sp.]|nr:hypothetical protein [Ottowia sp.]
MNTSCLRRAARLLTAVVATALLASCGGGEDSVVHGPAPGRFLVMGDDMLDVGQKNGYVYTVNDGTPFWVQVVASNYGLFVQPSGAGGWGFAQGGARISAAGAAPSVTAQVDEMLARTTLNATDVVLIGGGMNDIVAAVEAHGVSAEATAAVEQAGNELAQQVRRIVAAGAKEVLVVGVPWMGNTPWGRALNQDGINKLSQAFNYAALGDIEGHHMGDTVLVVENALLFNLFYDDPEAYGFTNGRDAVCTTPVETPCTRETVYAQDYDYWLFADDKHFTPSALRLYGAQLYNAFNNRW